MPSKKSSACKNKAVSKRRSARPKSQYHEALELRTQPAAIVQRARLDPYSLTGPEIRHLQDAIGNRAVDRLLIQAAPNSGTARSPLAARRKLGKGVLSMPVQRQEAAEEAAAPEVVVTDDDREEYEDLRRRTGRADNTGFDSVEDYVAYRDDYFGGRAVYDEIKATADAEWDAHAPIRNRVGQTGESADRRKALYRWLRLEYRRQGIDTAEDIVALMRRGMTAELRTIVERVREAHPGLRTGGFVARPIKHTDVGYRLGTLSEHGTGRAIDIRPQSDNPQIPRGSWRLIERLAGRRVDRSKRRWRDNPAELWQDVHDLNQEYEAAVNRQVEEIRARREAAGRDPDDPNPLDEVLADSRWLRRRAENHGLSFFTLAQDLVLALHGEGLDWGVTFRTPDLHHFELD